MEGSVSSSSKLRLTRRGGFWLILALSCARLAHVNLLWADEDYHLAAALQLLHGKVPYRDFWYDKPPLNAVYYLLDGGLPGWALRSLDAVYVMFACYLGYRIARSWWGEAEGWVSALLLAFFTTFYLPSAVIPFAADALMLVPHLATMYCALRRQAFVAGLWCGVAFLFNAKALFLLAVCVIWLAPEWFPLLGGVAIPLGAAFGSALFSGAWSGYLEQVWRWGLIYTIGSPVAHPFLNGTVRTLDWLGFHAAVALGLLLALLNISRSDRWKLGSWLGLSFAAVCIGWRFAPHYFLQFLAPAVAGASRGFVIAWKRHEKLVAGAVVLLLLVPFVRFGPRYASLMIDDITEREPRWSDVAMDLDSQDAARRIRSLARPSDTLFVWGYRPDMYVYTRMVPNGLFWDSQPLTGVPADRHLTATTAIYGGPSQANREKLAQTKPIWLVDGLGLLNPKLKPATYPELRRWLSNYKIVDQTKLSLIYRRIE